MSRVSKRPSVSRSPDVVYGRIENNDYVSEDGGSTKYYGKMLTIKTSNYKSMFGIQPLANYDSQESMGLGSFTMKSTPAPPKVPVEALLNYLSENISKIIEGSSEFRRFEELTAELFEGNEDVKISRILKDNGWVGSRYQTSGDHQLDLQLLLQALSNYYLRYKKMKLSNSLFNLLGPDADSRGLDKIVPFCPDMLLSYLRHNQFPPLKKGSSKIDSVPCISFTGACMLVDISGFSKFSGAMCSKGVHGLDELRHATNGFLGHFVRIVYDFDGDVIAFAGDALICVFRDLDKPVPSLSPMAGAAPLPPKPSKTGSVSIANCCFRAMQCAAILKNHEASSSMTTMSLSTHIGLSYGDMKMALLGGLNDQYVYVMNGQCVSALSSCVTDAQSKQVVCTKECLDYALEHGDVNCFVVEKSTSTSPFPNFLVEDNDSVLHSAQNKRQSFHERVGMIKKYSVFMGNNGFPGQNGSTPNSFSSTPTPPQSSTSLLTPTAAAAAQAAADLAEAVAQEEEPTTLQVDVPDETEVVMLKKKTHAINISSGSPSASPNNSTRGPFRTDTKKSNAISFLLDDDIDPLEDEIEIKKVNSVSFSDKSPERAETTEHKKINGISFQLEKSDTAQISELGYETSVSGKSPGGMSEPSPQVARSTSANPRLYANPQSSIYNFDKQFSERSVGEDLNDDGVYQASFVENIAMFVPVVILAAACNGTMDTLGELRQVTTVFIELKSYDPVKNSDPRSLQPFFLMAQKYLHESGGFLRQFLVDDKGCVLIAMWGTPSFTYSNNSCRALHFAVSVNQKTAEMGHRCSAGVTTGTVFCGTVGAVERCDYAGVGTDVNMAARLMSKSDGGVLVDKLTYQSFNQEMKQLLTEQYPMQLKGSAEPVTPYKYTSTTIPPIRAVDDIGGKNVFLKRKVMTLISEMLDRQATQSHLGRSSSGNLTAAREFTRDLSPTSKGKIEVLVVTGATGTGKSVAAHYFRHASLKQGVPVIDLKASSSLSVVPYGIIKEFILELLPMGRKEDYVAGENSFVGKLVLDCYPCDNLEYRQYVTKQLEILLGLTDEATFRNHDLLNRLSNSYSESSVNMLLEERSTTSFALTDPSNKEESNMPSMSSIIYQVLVTLIGGSPCSLIVENYHFCDELSWHELLEIISHKDQELTLCIMLTIRTSPLDLHLRTFSSDPDPNVSRSSSLSPGSNRQSLHLNFKGLSQVRTPTLSMANLQKSSTPPPMTGSSKLARPRSILKLDSADDDDLDHVHDPYILSMEESFRELLKLSETTVHELTALTQDEVKHILVDVLGDGHVTQDLVLLVAEVCAGNIYWCKSIASFIKERDISEFKGLLSSNKTTANPLRDLVLCRMEKLSSDLILILKHVSVIGHEFNESLVQGIMNISTKQRKGIPMKLRDQLLILEKSGFIYLLEEYPVPIYGFQNELIRNTLYELLPPGDASAIHCHIAQYIEREFVEDLRPFYPTLAVNFSLGGKGMRHLAFKYQMKAANHAINHGAYNDGLIYTQAAAELVERKVEYIVLIEVVQHAIIDLTKLLPKPAPLEKNNFTMVTIATESDASDFANADYESNGFLLKSNSSSPKALSQHYKQASHLSNPYSRSFYTEHESDLKQKINAYVAIKVSCENELAKLKAQVQVPKSDTTSGSNHGKAKKKDIRAMLMRKNTSHKLSWQLSTALPQAKYGSGRENRRGSGESATNAEAAKDGVDETPATARNDSAGFDEEDEIRDSVSPIHVSTNGCCILS